MGGLELLGPVARLRPRRNVSYRGVKRVLGETNLERKCRWLFGMCLAVLIAGSFWWYGARTEQLVYDNTRVAAAALVEPVLLKVHNKFFERPENKELIEGWEQLWQSKEGYDGAVINPTSGNPERQPKTRLDEQVFAEFRAMQPYHEPDDGSASSRGEQFRDERDEANGEYYYYSPIWAHDGNCINCHISRGASGQALIGAGAREIACFKWAISWAW